MHIGRICAFLRFKLFRLLSGILLGKIGSSVMVGQRFVSISHPVEGLLKRIRNCRQERTSTVQKYSLADVPTEWVDCLTRESYFPVKNAYLLDDVCVGPRTGVVWVPNVGVIRESVSCTSFFYLHGVQDTMVSAGDLDESCPVCVFSSTVFFHALLEELLRVVECRNLYQDVKVLVSDSRPRYVDDMLAFIGVRKEEIIVCKRPMRVKQCAFIPKWNDSGEINRDDLLLLREVLIKNVHITSGHKAIYVSRSRCQNRSLDGELELESVLASRGFKICYFETMSFEEQLAAVIGADVIVAPHGSGLSNLIVARPGTVIVEMISPNWIVPCFARMASLLGLNYHCVRTEPVEHGRFGVPMQRVMSLLQSLENQTGMLVRPHIG